MLSRSVFRTVSKTPRVAVSDASLSRSRRILCPSKPGPRAPFEMEPVALNNHPRTTWPKDQRRDLQSRHRQLAATRSLSRPIITGTYSAKCSPLLKRTSGPRTPDPECHHRRSLDEQEGWSRRYSLSLPPPSSLYICPSRSLFISLLFALTISDNQGPRPVCGWTASLIRANYAGRLKRFNCPTRRTSL